MRDFAVLYTSADLADIAAYLDSIFNVPKAALVVEYHHADFDHYFVTALVGEIDRLDRGDFKGWSRTGASFRVVTDTGMLPVCRFFSASFAPRSSHFYTASPSECAAVQVNPRWTFEGEAFRAELPSDEGQCKPARVGLYRLYNGGRGGAPNHRFTASTAVRAAMILEGWLAEGIGPLGVAMCVASVAEPGAR